MGKWFGWRGEGEKKADSSDTDAEKHDSYVEFIQDSNNKEAKERYEKLGGNVDAVYEDMYKPELDAGYQDELKMGKISLEQS